MAGLAFIRCSMLALIGVGKLFRGRKAILRVPADGAATASPFLEATAVEDVLAQDGKETGAFVHALKADGA